MAALRFGFSQTLNTSMMIFITMNTNSNPDDIALHQHIIASHNALYHHITNTFYGEYRFNNGRAHLA